MTSTSRNLARSNILCIIFVHTDNTTYSLCHLDDRHLAQHDAVSETMNVDTFAENRIVKEDKFTVWIFAPLGESIKELLTIHLGFVHISTVLRCNVKHVKTTLFKFTQHITASEHIPHDFCGGSRYQDLRIILLNVIKNVHDHVAVCLSSSRTIADKIYFVGRNLRRNDATTVDEFLSTNRLNHLSVDRMIVHTVSIRVCVMLGSSSKEIRGICRNRCSSSRDKVRFCGGIVCLVEISDVHINTSINNTMQGMISGEDDTMSTNSFAHLYSKFDALTLCSLEMMRLTTMNVDHLCVVDELTELSTELISKQNPRCYDNSNLRCRKVYKTTLHILNHDESLAATSRNKNLT